MKSSSSSNVAAQSASSAADVFAGGACAFCSDLPAVTQLTAGKVMWNACDECARLIHGGSRRALERRAADLLKGHTGLEALRREHELFWQAWVGKRLTSLNSGEVERLIGFWPKGLHPGSLGALPAIDERDPDAHRWLLGEIERVRGLEGYKTGTYQRAVREGYNRLYGWAIPSDAALQAIWNASPGGIVEVGAGNGYWAFLLRFRGLDLVALDKCPVHTGENRYWRDRRFRINDRGEEAGAQTEDREALPPGLLRSWTPITLGDAESLGQYGAARTLLMVWPEWTFAHTALTEYQGSTLAFVGEYGEGSISGDARFFNALEQGWQLVSQVEIPRFAGFNDRLFLYKRK